MDKLICLMDCHAPGDGVFKAGQEITDAKLVEKFKASECFKLVREE